MKNIQANSTLWEAILQDTQNNLSISSYKFTIAVLFRLMAYKSQYELKDVQNLKVLGLYIGNSMMPGLPFLGRV